MPGRSLDDPECTAEELRERCGLPENACCRNCGEFECIPYNDDEDDWDNDPGDDVCGNWVLSPPDEGTIYEIIDNRVVTSFGAVFDDSE